MISGERRLIETEHSYRVLLIHQTARSCSLKLSGWPDGHWPVWVHVHIFFHIKIMSSYIQFHITIMGQVLWTSD